MQTVPRENSQRDDTSELMDTAVIEEGVNFEIVDKTAIRLISSFAS